MGKKKNDGKPECKNFDCSSYNSVFARELCEDYCDDVKKIAEAFLKFIDKISYPSLGALTKKEIEVLLFVVLKEHEILDLDSKDPIYDLIKKLRVSRTKARNLLYEISLRQKDDKELEKELYGLLESTLVLKDNNWILLEVSDPYLRDYIKKILKENSFISDYSFSSEVLRISHKAYVYLLFRNLKEEESEKVLNIIEKLIDKSEYDIDYENLKNKSIKERIIGLTESLIGEFVKQNIGEKSTLILKSIFGNKWESIKNYIV